MNRDDYIKGVEKHLDSTVEDLNGETLSKKALINDKYLSEKNLTDGNEYK